MQVVIRYIFHSLWFGFGIVPRHVKSVTREEM